MDTLCSNLTIRYAFRSTEKAALQEIGPRFTLKLRWMKKGIPVVQSLGDSAKGLERADEDEDENEDNDKDEDMEKPLSGGNDNQSGGQLANDEQAEVVTAQPSTGDEYIWQWKVNILQYYISLSSNAF